METLNLPWQPNSGDLTEDLNDYGFEVPEELIAQKPAQTRGRSKLLIVRRNPEKGMAQLEAAYFDELPQIVSEEKKLNSALWLRNRTKVIPARFFVQRESGGVHEILVTSELSECVWSGLIKNVKKIKVGQRLRIVGALNNECVEFLGGSNLRFHGLSKKVDDFLEEVGRYPLPPYIKREADELDKDRYQSIWATQGQAVAAPTASLHFTKETEDQLTQKGARFADIRLDVGLGTFSPLRSNELNKVDLHKENFFISKEMLASLNAEAKGDSNFLCIGTTALRVLESLSLGNVEFNSDKVNYLNTASSDLGIEGNTSIFIKPGFEIKYAKSLLTNFHLPNSSLFVLLCTFAGSRKLVQDVYKYAVSKKYRFFSYGDATLWI